MSAHTPGPWELKPPVEGAAPSTRVIGRPDDNVTVIAVVEFDTPEERANAHLIAHTPALCDALLKLYQVCEAMDAENQAERPTEDKYQQAMVDAAGALIAAEVLE